MLLKYSQSTKPGTNYIFCPTTTSISPDTDCAVLIVDAGTGEFDADPRELPARLHVRCQTADRRCQLDGLDRAPVQRGPFRGIKKEVSSYIKKIGYNPAAFTIVPISGWHAGTVHQDVLVSSRGHQAQEGQADDKCPTDPTDKPCICPRERKPGNLTAEVKSVEMHEEALLDNAKNVSVKELRRVYVAGDSKNSPPSAGLPHRSHCLRVQGEGLSSFRQVEISSDPNRWRIWSCSCSRRFERFQKPAKCQHTEIVVVTKISKNPWQSDDMNLSGTLLHLGLDGLFLTHGGGDLFCGVLLCGSLCFSLLLVDSSSSVTGGFFFSTLLTISRLRFFSPGQRAFCFLHADYVVLCWSASPGTLRSTPWRRWQQSPALIRAISFMAYLSMRKYRFVLVGFRILGHLYHPIFLEDRRSPPVAVIWMCASSGIERLFKIGACR
ncbi:elongation factor-1 alpha [Culex quinquefasciatus]|uniref:Elongation factor-1 alpha n=1 Tax=Culex quinquefasciatus TaxID=7176 RepID=B0WBK6_CULQU|nr:elongation factor-1 alpha [Culex quinquefasciatus]|eukprot:XP_001846090.1 elongation factor-1 alpha [Culex quinquefasciatus]